MLLLLMIIKVGRLLYMYSTMYVDVEGNLSIMKTVILLVQARVYEDISVLRSLRMVVRQRRNANIALYKYSTSGLSNRRVCRILMMGCFRI